MNREIKFRIWSLEAKEMFEDFPLVREDKYLNDVLADENYIFMQFTGLLDKNGKEIYEGDILEMLSLSERVKNLTFICAIDEFGVNFQANHPDRNNNRFGGNNLWWNSDDWIIKGNIYENPELLTK